MASPALPLRKLRVKFWGVRGSTPTPQPENLRYGGNTPCVEVRTAANETVIFDAGTGIRGLGRYLVRDAAGEPIDAVIFLTHFHWDHIQGIPFFAPIYDEKNRITFYSSLERHAQEVLEGQMSKPYFPVDFGQVAAKRYFEQIARCATVSTKGVVVRPFPLNHPQGAAGYRIEYEGAVIVYATDYEHGDRGLDVILREYAEGADILICDSQYTAEEYETHRGWGHSTWANAIEVARDAGVKQLVLFHHDPEHNDDTMAKIVKEARRSFENTEVAWEGFTVTL